MRYHQVSPGEAGDREIIRFGQEESHIRMMVRRDGISRKIDVHLKKNKSKGIAVDGIPIKKASELFGIVNLVFFSPEDLNIIKNGPGERRRFPGYGALPAGQNLSPGSGRVQPGAESEEQTSEGYFLFPRLADTLDVWDMQLVHYGKKSSQPESASSANSTA